MPFRFGQRRVRFEESRHGRRERKQKMKIPKTSITLVLTFGLWLGLVLGCSSLRKAAEEKRAEREGPPITISAEDLYKAYESSEADADKLYQGKIVMVTGTVGTTSTPDEGMGRPTIILVDAHQKPIVNCFGFATDNKEAISKLKTGQKVTVKGKCMGKVMTDIPVLEDSVLQ
jgi:hypothetical protein